MWSRGVNCRKKTVFGTSTGGQTGEERAHRADEAVLERVPGSKRNEYSTQEGRQAKVDEPEGENGDKKSRRNAYYPRVMVGLV